MYLPLYIINILTCLPVEDIFVYIHQLFELKMYYFSLKITRMLTTQNMKKQYVFALMKIWGNLTQPNKPVIAGKVQDLMLS
jgi:hypothetical protein